MSNPFTDAYEALWDCLEDRSEFTELVLAKNRIKLTDRDAGNNRDPWDRLRNVRSFPSVAIVPIPRPESESRMEADSDTTDVEKWFGILIASGDQRADTIFEVEFAILRALAAWRDTVGAVQWEGKNCVVDCAFFHHPAELDRKLLELGIRGWSTAWVGRVWFYFATADLLATDSSSSSSSSSSGAD